MRDLLSRSYASVLFLPLLAPTLFSSFPIQEGQTPAQAGSGDEVPVRKLKETVVTATITPLESIDSPYSEEVLTEQDMQRRSYRSLPQALRDTPGVFVQETAVGQGSPYIRGFTGYQNLFLVDGFRLNNSVFRSGPNQYWNTIDPYTVESMEIVKGPGSVLYGSDAIGGTVNVHTRGAQPMEEGEHFKGQLFYRYATAEDSHSGRAESSIEAGNTRVLMGVGGKDFGDLHAGGSTGDQPNTGYSELNADFKSETFLDADTLLTFGYQHVYQNDVPRTHATIFSKSFQGTSIGSDRRRDLDQDRTLAYGHLHGENVDSFFDRYNFGLSWHSQSEERHRTRGNGVQEEQGFDVGQAGLIGNLSSETAIGRLTYGIDFYHDDVSSSSSTSPIQGPVADDATYDLFGLYVQDEIEATDRTSFILGGRFNYAAADADSVLEPSTNTQIAMHENWKAFVGSARALYRLDEGEHHLFGGVSQGFRAPNLSDLTRFDTARSNEYEIPSIGLDPEYYLTYEVGLKSETERYSSELAFFYTDIKDQIDRFPTGNVDGGGNFEVAKANVGDGYVYGVEYGAAFELVEQWTLFGNATYQYGEVTTYPTAAQIETTEHITRLMPFSAQLGLRWETVESDKWIEAQVVYAADADKLNTRDLGDTQRIPPNGTPEYLVANLRGGMGITQDVTVDLGIENIGDVNYRVHGSGHNMPGLNFVVGLRLSM